MMGFVIGVDAGGSRTRVTVADSDGETIATSEREGAAVRPGELERSASLVTSAVRDALTTVHPTKRAPHTQSADEADDRHEGERRALSEALINESLADEV